MEDLKQAIKLAARLHEENKMKKEKLTKKEALQQCVALWSWLAENPFREKVDWPGWEENGGKLQAKSYCFACEFSLQQEQEHRHCNANCILPCFAFLCGCVATNSPYIRWVYTKNPESRKRNAKLIRDSANVALIDMGKMKGE